MYYLLTTERGEIIDSLPAEVPYSDVQGIAQAMELSLDTKIIIKHYDFSLQPQAITQGHIQAR